MTSINRLKYQKIENDLARVLDSNDVKFVNDHFSELNVVLGQCTQALYTNKESSKYAADIEGKLIRIYFANESLSRISEGFTSKVNNKLLKIYDIFSIHSIIRQQISNFTNLYYLFLEDISVDERTLRVLIYKLHGLQKQISLTNNISTPNIDREVLINEERQVKKSIESLPIFSSANKKFEKNLVKPEYALLEKPSAIWERLAMPCIGAKYNYLSNYIHSEYMSDRQYSTFFREGKYLHESICTNLIFSSRLTSVFITLLSNNFNYIHHELLNLPENLRLKIYAWSYLSRIN